MKLLKKIINFLDVDKEIFRILFALGIISICAFFLSACPKNKKPLVDVKVYAGDSVNAGIVRAQDNEMISCADPKFDNYLCVSYDDLEKLILIINSCKKWK